MSFEGPNLALQTKMITLSVVFLTGATYLLSDSKKNFTEPLVTTISAAIFGQVIANLLGSSKQSDARTSFLFLAASFTPLPSLISGITALGLRHLRS